MKVKMNVKSTSDSIVQDVYEYEDKIMLLHVCGR